MGRVQLGVIEQQIEFGHRVHDVGDLLLLLIAGWWQWRRRRRSRRWRWHTAQFKFFEDHFLPAPFRYDFLYVGEKALAQLLLEHEIVRRKDELSLREVSIGAHTPQIDAGRVRTRGRAWRSLQQIGRVQATRVRVVRRQNGGRVRATSRLDYDFIVSTCHFLSAVFRGA